MLHRFCLLIAGLSLTAFVNAQDTATLVNSVPEIAPVFAGMTHIQWPKPPEGYILKLQGSDHYAVINTNGEIHQPLVDTKVLLYFELIKTGDQHIKLDVSKTVEVPGKFRDPDELNQPAPFIIPRLKEWKGNKGAFVLKSGASIVIDPSQKEALSPLGHQLEQELIAQGNFKVHLKIDQPAKGDIYLQLHPSDSVIGKEGYYLNIGDFIQLDGADYQGLFWGTRTLLQLVEHSGTIPKGLARDYPSYPVRGFILDVGRKFFTLEFLRDYVKLLSYYKMNDFQVHLSDNGFKKYFGENWDSTYSAFRLENDRFPGLTAKDGHYTKQEFRALQALGRQYGINIVPEIDVPAHALSFTKAVPAIGSKKYGMDHLDLHNPLTDSVIQQVFREYLQGPDPVFTGETVDIGTDEYAKADAEAFRGFTDRMIGFVQGYGKKVRLWGALTWAKGQTPVRVKGVTMNSWYNGYANPIEMKKLGYPQISTPDGWLYIVPAAGYYYDYLNLKNLYRKWTPSLVGDIQFQPGDPIITGGAFAVWNDIAGNGISQQDVTDRVFPALQVLAQKMWGATDTVLDFNRFNQQRKMIGAGPALNILGKYEHIPYTADSVLLNGFPVGGRKLHQAKISKGSGAGDSRPVLAISGDSSYVTLNDYPEIGYNYSVAFSINPQKGNTDETASGSQTGVNIFRSKHATVKLKQTGSGNLGFSREGYDYSFNYKVPENTWTRVVITGTAKGTCLYINGQLQDSLYNHWIQFKDKDKSKVRKIETLFFPLENIGGFSGQLKGLKVWRKVLTPQEIGKM